MNSTSVPASVSAQLPPRMIWNLAEVACVRVHSETFPARPSTPSGLRSSPNAVTSADSVGPTPRIFAAPGAGEVPHGKLRRGAGFGEPSGSRSPPRSARVHSSVDGSCLPRKSQYARASL